MLEQEVFMTRHLAELNIGRLLAPTDDPRVADFMNALDLINGMGKADAGFCLDDGGLGRTRHWEHGNEDRR